MGADQDKSMSDALKRSRAVILNNGSNEAVLDLSMPSLTRELFDEK